MNNIKYIDGRKENGILYDWDFLRKEFKKLHTPKDIITPFNIHEFYKNGKMFCNPHVEDFLALIDGAQYVVTDSFHATAFSLNFNKL